MNRSSVLRPLAAVTALATAMLTQGPARPSPVPFTTHQTMQGAVLLYGTLAALHPAARTGDLALPDGTLLPLRFTLSSQLRGLRVGDELAVGAEAHGHARLLVRMLERQDFSKHWRGDEFSKHWRGEDLSKHWRVQGFSKHWRDGDYSKHWRIHGVVARTLGHGDAEILGVDGAAAVVHVGGAGIGAATSSSSSHAGVAYAQDVSALKTGQEIDARVGPADAGAAPVAATTVDILAPRAPGMDVEGQVTGVDRTTGTITLTDENGQCARVTLGPRVAAYSLGQDVEAWGAPGQGAGAVLNLTSDTTAEHENLAPVTPAPAAAQAQGQGSQSGLPAATPTAAFVIPAQPPTIAPATPAAAFIIPVNSPPPATTPANTAVPVMATQTNTAIPVTTTSPSAPTTPPSAPTTPAKTPLATTTPAKTPLATTANTSTPTVTATKIATATETGIPARTATPVATALSTATPTPTKTCRDKGDGVGAADDDCD